MVRRWVPSTSRPSNPSVLPEVLVENLRNNLRVDVKLGLNDRRVDLVRDGFYIVIRGVNYRTQH
jgi:hypothetical protein